MIRVPVCARVSPCVSRLPPVSYTVLCTGPDRYTVPVGVLDRIYPTGTQEFKEFLHRYFTHNLRVLANLNTTETNATGGACLAAGLRSVWRSRSSPLAWSPALTAHLPSRSPPPWRTIRFRAESHMLDPSS